MTKVQQRQACEKLGVKFQALFFIEKLDSNCFESNQQNNFMFLGMKI